MLDETDFLNSGAFLIHIIYFQTLLCRHTLIPHTFNNQRLFSKISKMLQVKDRTQTMDPYTSSQTFQYMWSLARLITMSPLYLR